MKNVGIKGAFRMLGHRGVDKVNKFEGIVTSVSFDLFGCIQVVLTPDVIVKDGKIEKQEGYWFDVNRINIISIDLVMDNPFTKQGQITEVKDKGAADKPLP